MYLQNQLCYATWVTYTWVALHLWMNQVVDHSKLQSRGGVFWIEVYRGLSDFVPKFAVGVCNRNQVMQWRSREELQRSSSPECHRSWWAVGFAPYLWSVKKVETALLSEGQASDTSCQVVLVNSSHFVDRDRLANGRRAVCDCAKLLYKSLKMKGALLPTIRTKENIRSAQRYWNIREKSNNLFQPLPLDPKILSSSFYSTRWDLCKAGALGFFCSVWFGSGHEWEPVRLVVILFCCCGSCCCFWPENRFSE